MSSINHVFVAIDDSGSSESAARFAIGLAKRTAASLSFGNALDLVGVSAACVQPFANVGLEQLLGPLDAESESVLAVAAGMARAAGVATETRKLSGSAATAILESIPAAHADAIVMGTHGYQGAARLFLGSVAENVLRRANVPVFIAPANARPGAPDEPLVRIAAALDGSESATAAFELALDLARTEHAQLSILHAVASSEDVLLAGDANYGAMDAEARRDDDAETLLSSATRRAALRGVAVETFLLEGDPATSIVTFVSEHGSDLLAMGTHGRRGLKRLFLGSVAETVVRSSSVPVVVVQPELTREGALNLR